jgi:RNA ligase
MVITEKLDGTNSAVGIVELPPDEGQGVIVPDDIFHVVQLTDISATAPASVRYFGMYAQSRNRLIRPGKVTDNYGFAQWVCDNAPLLVTDLGPGVHFGEWWGNGIQRGYGLPEGDKRFSLFNVSRYSKRPLYTPGLATVPVLQQWTFDTDVVRDTLDELVRNGSQAAPGYMRPEGMVVFHTAAGQVFKVTVDNDASPKSLVE